MAAFIYNIGSLKKLFIIKFYVISSPSTWSNNCDSDQTVTIMLPEL